MPTSTTPTGSPAIEVLAEPLLDNGSTPHIIASDSPPATSSSATVIHPERTDVVAIPANSPTAVIGQVAAGDSTNPFIAPANLVTNQPIPFICDDTSLSRRFYVVTVGRQVGVFDNR